MTRKRRLKTRLNSSLNDEKPDLEKNRGNSVAQKNQNPRFCRFHPKKIEIFELLGNFYCLGSSKSALKVAQLFEILKLTLKLTDIS
jgi:hypothetical protein